MENRTVLTREGSKSRVGSRLGGGQGVGAEASGGLWEGVCSVGKESSHLRRQFQPAGAMAGRAGVASQGLPLPLPWRIRQPSAHFAGMSLWQLPTCLLSKQV